MVIHVTRDAETDDLLDVEPDVADPAPGDPVGRVNLSAAAEADDLGPGGEAPYEAAFVHESTRQKVLFGAIAVLLMALALVVMLQGVFEQKLPT
jgi:hypothetical protein